MTWKLLIGGFVLIALASCSSSDPGAGMITVNREFTNSVLETHDAALSTLESQNLKIESDKSDSLGASIVAKRATGDDKILVDVKSLEMGKSKVSVRVPPGDRSNADMILNQIGEKLSRAAK
jgi:hypothetical protein